MRILVTGGAGFIGSHLCEKLIDLGHQVICVDDLFTGVEDNIKILLNNPNFKFIKHDIVKPLFLDDTILSSPRLSTGGSSSNRLNQIYNLACPASPAHYQHNPVHTIKTSTLGVINMLGLARKHNARILQASTSEVYGDPEVHPQTEEYRGNVNTVGPRACYDEGKRCAESLFSDYHRMHDLEIKIARIFNTYGSRMAFDDGRVVSNFVLLALKGEDLVVDGDGSQTRSFCYVDDLVGGIIKMMNSDKKIFGPINLGNPDEFTIKKLAELVIKLAESKSKIKYNGIFREDDPMRRCPDISKARKILNWEPKVPLEEGLKKMIENFKERL